MIPGGSTSVHTQPHHLAPLDVTRLDSWQALAAHRKAMQQFSLRQAFADDPERFQHFSLNA
ncbi:hypothetical protein, partial [Pseudomonas sp. BN417]|uniref:hypothetical protein n=1 Tax=Pseudomonas sp. BN417 TaxID=2567890 RepID=UPI0032AFE694